MKKPMGLTIVNESLEGSAALPAFMREYADLIEHGWARPYTAHNDKHRIIYAQSGTGRVAGGIVYGLNNLTHVGWKVFSFTVPDFRRQGVYTLLHRELENLMRTAGMQDMASHVHVGNKVSQASCQRVGMVSEYLRMNLNLNPSPKT